MQANRHSQRVTLLLVAIATALVQAALHSRQPGAGFGLLCVSVVLAVGVGILARRRDWSDWGIGSVATVLSVALLPVVWDAVSRLLFRVGEPYEVQLAYVLRNVMLVLAATPRLPRATAQATLCSFFLVVFGFLWSAGPVGIALLVAYSVFGAWWLLAAYWDRLGGRFADASERSIPLKPAGAALGLLGLLALGVVPLATQSNVTTALAGFFPSSGGTQQNDPFAYGGVGDGDQMVAAKDQASSFGPVDSDLFLESEMPSLYDAFNEFSDAKPSKKKRMRRAIPLAPSQMQANHERRGLNQQAKREFSTVRQVSRRIPKTDDRLSAALLQVKGRTPQHLALETYDRWDGRALLAAESPEPLATQLKPADASGRRWLDLSVSRPAELYNATTPTQVRVINLKTSDVPAPSGVKRLTIDGLHSKSLFEFADGDLEMAVEFVPQLTIFDVVSQLRDRRVAPPVHATNHEDAPSVIREMARDWTRGVSLGWPQVDAIVRRLRGDYTLDPEAMVPDSADDAVVHFLTEGRRGPDYLFATSAAVMLRSLGYETRVRSGFYARPDRYVRTAQLTPVLAEDAHFWVEVLTNQGARITPDGRSLRGVWVTVEPTPGYDVLYAPETLWAWLARHCAALGAAIAAHPLVTGLAIAGVGLVHTTRRRLLDAALVTWWSIRSRTVEAGRLARLTLRLLEWRAWGYKRSRPVGTTLGRWEALRAHDDFVGLASWALYGQGAAAPMRTDAAREACRRVIRMPLRKRQPPNASGPHHESRPIEQDR